jgi:hypothetical protein
MNPQVQGLLLTAENAEGRILIIDDPLNSDPIADNPALVNSFNEAWLASVGEANALRSTNTQQDIH